MARLVLSALVAILAVTGVFAQSLLNQAPQRRAPPPSKPTPFVVLQAAAPAVEPPPSPEIGHVWCRYQSKGKTVTETRCAAVFEPANCGKYTLIFSEKSKAVVTGLCGQDAAVNGVSATIYEVTQAGYTYYIARLDSGERFDFEAIRDEEMGGDVPTAAMWKPGWEDYGQVGQCYFLTSRETAKEHCVKREVCTTAAGGEGGCDRAFISAKGTQYAYSNTEEFYWNQAGEFSHRDIIDQGAGTCYPHTRNMQFCFEPKITTSESPVPVPTPSGNGFQGEVYAGQAIFGVDNSNLIQFLENNKQNIVYLDVAVGYEVGTLEQIKLQEKCS